MNSNSYYTLTVWDEKLILLQCCVKMNKHIRILCYLYHSNSNMNAKIINTQILHCFKYDLKDNWRLHIGNFYVLKFISERYLYFVYNMNDRIINTQIFNKFGLKGYQRFFFISNLIFSKLHMHHKNIRTHKFYNMKFDLICN